MMANHTLAAGVAVRYPLPLHLFDALQQRRHRRAQRGDRLVGCRHLGAHARMLRLDPRLGSHGLTRSGTARAFPPAPA